jgi:hypothetical protein
MSTREKLHSFKWVILTFTAVILIIASAHWSLVKMYNSWCVPSTFYGFVGTIFTLGSPSCQFINYVQFELAKYYMELWYGAGIALVTFTISQFTTKPTNV